MQVFDTVTQYFDTKKTIYFKEPPAKLLKTYLKDSGNIYIRSYLTDFNLIKLLLEIKSSFLSHKIRPSLNMRALKVDISLLNHHCTPTDWLADWLTEALRLQKHSRKSDTRTPEILTALAIAIAHSKSTWAVGNSRNLSLGHSRDSGTRDTWVHEALWHLKGTWAIETLYLEDPN